MVRLKNNKKNIMKLTTPELYHKYMSVENRKILLCIRFKKSLYVFLGAKPFSKYTYWNI